ncbi:MAG: histone deacetylase family protein [Halobacteriaceae archaeon]
MRFGFSGTCLDHDPGARHPERPERLRAIREGLQPRHGVSYVDADPAPRAAVERAHDPDYVAEVEAFCADGGGEWDPETVATEATWPAALASAGLAAWAAGAALDGADGRETPFALGRPPGHHATRDDAMGFCFLNNAAIAAEVALAGPDAEGAGADDGGADGTRRTPSGGAAGTAERVAILDWDVHHGNGTQDIFADRGDVFYASVHEEGLYPGTGAADEVGTGPGEGTTLNVPLPPGAEDGDYDLVFRDLLGPAVERFEPDLLLVSAGFDAHRHDPISRMHLSTEGYGHLAALVRTIADAAGAGLGFVLEGGYGLDTLADGVGMVHEVFDGYEPDPQLDAPAGTVADLVEAGRERHGLS